MTLKSFLTPAIAVAGVLFVLATLQQATGLFVQTSSSAGVVSVAAEATPTAPRIGLLIPIADGAVVARAGVSVATVTPLASPATETPVAAVIDETATPTPEASATPTTVPATEATIARATATQTSRPEPTPTATLLPATTATPTATSTAVQTPTPIACPPDVVALSIEAADGVLRLDAYGEAKLALLNEGKAELPAGSILRFLAEDDTLIRAGMNVRVGDEELIQIDDGEGWRLPALAQGSSMELVLGGAKADAVGNSKPAIGAEMPVATSAQERVFVAEVAFACNGLSVAVVRHKLMLQPVPPPAATPPVATKIERLPMSVDASEVLTP